MSVLQVFYNLKQSVASNIGFSPSAGKPAAFVDSVRDMNRVHVVSDWRPLSEAEIAVAHHEAHVRDTLACNKPNGFGNTLPEVAASLPWTNGSFYHAARFAVLGRTFSFSPTSGFHHATYASAEGFCTFNGLMIAAILLHREGLVRRVGIVDLDAHFGNGTADIIQRLSIDYVDHLTLGALHPKYLGSDWGRFIADLPGYLEDRFSECDVLLYQAGADPHIDDPLGGYLTSEELRLRDRHVFRFARRRGIPVVWNLAGGYQTQLSKVLEIHRATVEECLAAMPEGV